MIEYIRQHRQLAAMILLWILAGIYLKPVVLVLIPISIILLKMRNFYTEMMIGFFVIMILSDSWRPSMDWASNMRNVYFFMMFLLFVLNQKQFPYPNKLYLPFIPFFILAIALIPRSPIPGVAIEKTASYILAFLVFPFYFLKIMHEDRDRFIRGLVFAVSLLLIYGFIMIAFFYDAAYLVGRYRGVMGNPNGLGMLCQIFFAFFTIVNINQKTLFTRNEKIFVYTLIFVSVLLTNSRNTIFTIFIFYTFYRFFKASYLIGIVLFLFIVIVNQIIMADLPHILSMLGLKEYMRTEHLEDGSGRIVAWKFAIEHIKHNVFFGKGMSYEVWLFITNAEYLSHKGHIGNSHNSWLAMWLNTGLTGLLLFLFGFFYRFFRMARQTVFGLPLMYSVLFSATFEAWLVGSLNTSTPFLLLIWSYFEAERQKALQPAPVMPAPFKPAVP